MNYDFQAGRFAIPALHCPAAGLDAASSRFAGRKVKIAFVRDRQRNCASSVVFPTIGIKGDLPPGGTLVLEVEVPETGELTFSCGMGMYRGALVAR